MKSIWVVIIPVLGLVAYFVLAPVWNLSLSDIFSPPTLSSASEAAYYYRVVGQATSAMAGALGLAIGFAYYLDSRDRDEKRIARAHVRSMRTVALERLDDYDNAVMEAVSAAPGNAQAKRRAQEQCRRLFDRVYDMLDVDGLLALDEDDTAIVLATHSTVDKSLVLWRTIGVGDPASASEMDEFLQAYRAELGAARRVLYASVR